MVSALTGDGLPDLMEHFAAAMPEGPFLYPEDQMTDLPLRWLAAEITREKLMLRLHEELPYHATVETDSWKEAKNGVRIEQTIFVERESQRKIVLGKGGQTIKAISTAAREEISALLERPVHLFLFVKVRENWSRRPGAVSGDGDRVSEVGGGRYSQGRCVATGMKLHCREWRSRFTWNPGKAASNQRKHGVSEFE